MNKISVFYDHILEAEKQTGCSLAAILKRVHRFGITGVEASIEHIAGCEEAFRTLLTAAELEIASVYGFFDFGRNGDLSGAFQAIDSARAVGSRLFLAIPGFIDNGEDRDRATVAMEAALRSLCDYAGKRGISITMEDFDDERSPSSTIRGLRTFLDNVPRLGAAFDTGNFIYSGEDALAAFGALADRIVHVHLKDRAIVPLPGAGAKVAVDRTALYPAPVGQGIIPMKELLSRLKARSYSGWLSIEHFGAPDALTFIEQSATWLKGEIG